MRRATAEAILGVDEVDQIERLARWRDRAFYWELIDEVRSYLGRHNRARFTELHEGIPDPKGDPAATAERRDDLEHVRAAVLELPRQQRLVLRGFANGILGRTIADVLGVSERRVWKVKREARAALARKLHNLDNLAL